MKEMLAKEKAASGTLAKIGRDNEKFIGKKTTQSLRTFKF